ncbi:MAG: hypothetical protein NTV62_03970 [Candidatus Gribaldobacteria bacterium]|nr:hypothetical protein [Candidatus Gribaldobacteria bacterium]
MVSFALAIKTFTICVFIFFGVFGYTCLIWTNRDKTKMRNIMGASAVALVYSFQIIVWGTLFFLVAYIIAFYANKFLS